MRIRTAVWWVAATFVLCGAAPAHADAKADKVAELIKKGDDAYKRRSTDKRTRVSLQLYLEALKLNPTSYAARWRAARAFFWLADNTTNQKKDKDLGWQGYAHALQAMRLNPKGVEGHFYAALCIGEYSKGLGIITALRKGIEGKFKAYLNASMRIKRCYDHGGADRAYGNFYHLVPWPKKDNKKALKYFSWSLKCSPRFPRTFYYMAVVLADEGEDKKALAALNTCVSINPKKGNVMDNYRFQWHCKKMLKKMKK